METDESVDALVRLTAERRLREHVVGAIARLGAAHIERIAEGLRNPQLEVRRAVIDALGRMKHPKATEVVGSLLDDEQPEVRLAVVLALKRLGTHSYDRQLLLISRNDLDPEVRKAAQRALER
jgi:HEAT repeat protein